MSDPQSQMVKNTMLLAGLIALQNNKKEFATKNEQGEPAPIEKPKYEVITRERPTWTRDERKKILARKKAKRK